MPECLPPRSRWRVHDSLRAEHQPETSTEILLIESMAQHYWLKQRALRLQAFCFDEEGGCDEKQLGLYLRYQTTHDRAFHKALDTVIKLRADKRKAEIGFVSQEMKLSRARGVRSTSASAPEQAELKLNRARQQAEEHARKQAVEKRKQEIHKWKVLEAEAQVDHRILLNVNLQTPEHRITVGPQHIIAAEKAA